MVRLGEDQRELRVVLVHLVFQQDVQQLVEAGEFGFNHNDFLKVVYCRGLLAWLEAAEQRGRFVRFL